MENELQIFNSSEFGEIRAFEKDGQPWFVANDISSHLDYRTTWDLTRILDDDEKDTQIVSTLGGNQEMTIINESGLYSAVLKSRKPEAKNFKKWVTSEILPTIRKHGAYMTDETLEKALLNPDFLIRLAIELKEEKQARFEAESKVKLLEPKAEFFDQVAESKDAIDIGSAAKVLNMGIGRNKLFETLRNKGILMQNNQPYQTYVDRGYFRVIEQKFTKPDGSTSINIKSLVYQKGLDFIRKQISN